MNDDLIITEHGKRNPMVRLLEGVLTIVLWLGYFYLMRHAVSVVLSYFGIAAPWGLQFNDVSVPPILDDIRLYIVVVVVNTVVFISWALYNKYRFGSRNRRRRSDPTTSSEMAEYFDVPSWEVDSTQAARRIVMVHDQSGHLIQSDVSDQA